MTHTPLTIDVAEELERLKGVNHELLEALKAVTELAEWYYTQAQKNTPLLQKPGQINIALAAIAEAEGEG